MKARPARLAPSSFDQSLFVEMAEALYAGHAIDLDADYDPAYAASDSQIEGESKDDDSDDSDDDLAVPAVVNKRTKGRPPKAVIPKKHKVEHKHEEEVPRKSATAKAPVGANARAVARAAACAKKAAAVPDAHSSSDEESCVASGKHASVSLDTKTLATMKAIEESARAAASAHELCRAAGTSGDGDISGTTETTHEESSEKHVATSASEMEVEITDNPAAGAAQPADKGAQKTDVHIGGLEKGVSKKYRLHSTDTFAKIFAKYCADNSLPRAAVKFMFDGAVMLDTQTPEGLDMETDESNFIEVQVKK